MFVHIKQYFIFFSLGQNPREYHSLVFSSFAHKAEEEGYFVLKSVKFRISRVKFISN